MQSKKWKACNEGDPRKMLKSVPDLIALDSPVLRIHLPTLRLSEHDHLYKSLTFSLLPFSSGVSPLRMNPQHLWDRTLLCLLLASKSQHRAGSSILHSFMHVDSLVRYGCYGDLRGFSKLTGWETMPVVKEREGVTRSEVLTSEKRELAELS